MSNIFHGLLTALITPFKENSIDFVSLKKLLEYQLQNNIDGLIIAGSTGEGSSLTFAEYKILLQEAVNIANKRAPIIAAVTSSNTLKAIEIAIAANRLMVDGLMVTLPPYIKPTSQGVYQHLKSVHDATDIPIMIYAIKSRTGIDIEDDCLFSLAELPRIIALKDSCADLERPLRISRSIKSDFNILAGDDELSLAFNAQGAKGCVSVTSNITPWFCKEIQDHWQRGKSMAALKIHQQLWPLYDALFNEVNPAGVKYAASYLGLCENELRLPLLPASQITQNKIKLAIKLLNE